MVIASVMVEVGRKRCLPPQYRGKKKIGRRNPFGELGRGHKIGGKSKLVRKTLGNRIFNSFIKSKKVEWDNYRKQIHPWGAKEYLPIFWEFGSSKEKDPWR